MFVIRCVMGKEGRTHYPVSFLQHGGIFPDVVSSTKVIILLSAGLMPTEARGNYLPEPPYLCETKTYHSLPLDTTCWQLFRPAINTAHFLFFVAEVNMPHYLTTDGLKKFSLLPETPLRPVAFATSATWLIRHSFFYYVNTRDSSSSSVSRSRRGPSRRCTTMSAVDSTSPEISNWTCGIVS